MLAGGKDHVRPLGREPLTHVVVRRVGVGLRVDLRILTGRTMQVVVANGDNSAVVIHTG